MTEFAKVLNSLLDEKGLKKSDLSRELNLPDQTVRNWFGRESLPGVDAALKVAKFLGVSVEYLMTGKDAAFSFRAEPSAPSPSGLERKISMLSAAQKKAVEAVIDSFLDGATGETTA